MQETSDALSKTADSDTVSTYQVSSVHLVTDKKLEAFCFTKTQISCLGVCIFYDLVQPPREINKQ